jgi:uncharacterized protein
MNTIQACLFSWLLLLSVQVMAEPAKIDVNDPHALIQLAKQYEQTNNILAFQLYQKAAGLNSAEAQYWLADYFYTGKRVAQDKKLASHWFKVAANNNHLQAQKKLAAFYLSAELFAKDEALAFHYFSAAAQSGDASAQVQLARMLLTGVGVEIDQVAAYKLMLKAVNQDSVPAMLLLAGYYKENPDQGDAWKVYYQAAERGDASAQYELGEYYLAGELVPENKKLAVEYLQQSAMQNNEHAALSLAKNYETGLLADKKHSMIRWYKKAAEYGSLEAKKNLAAKYFYAEGVEFDILQSVEYHAQAAEMGDAESQYALSLFFSQGVGVKKNMLYALLMLKRSANQHYPPAEAAMQKVLASSKKQQADAELVISPVLLGKQLLPIEPLQK